MIRASAIAVFASVVIISACGVAEDESETSASAVMTSDAGAECALAAPRDGACAEVWDPVCGCDGRTYDNACAASLFVTSSTAGACPADSGSECKRATPSPVACAEIWNPVCGCDGKTYDNDCLALLFVTSFSPGECASDAGVACRLPSPKATFCPQVFDPVCGCDGKTYGNPCVAARVVTSSRPGSCP